MNFNDFLTRVASDCVNATHTPLVMCRCCDKVTFCQPFTVQEFERTSHDEGRCDVDYTVTTGQCDDCLKAYGADEHCDPQEATSADA